MTQVCKVDIRSDVYSDPRSAEEAIRRSINSDRDLRNFLNMGSLDVNGFVRGVWSDGVEERLVGRKQPSQKDKERAGVKALAVLLVKWGKSLDKIVGGDDDEVMGEDGGDTTDGEGHKRADRQEIADLVGLQQKGRTALAVEALWDEVEPVSDWEGLLDLLLLDHSAAEDGIESRGRGRANGKSSAKDSVVDEAWRLEEVEESVLLEVLVASLRQAKQQVAGSKKASICLALTLFCTRLTLSQGEEETVANDITRALIKGLPRLFIKHQTDQKRIADVLLIPCLMNLDLYLEMRMITVSHSSCLSLALCLTIIYQRLMPVSGTM